MAKVRFIALEGIDFTWKTPFSKWLQRDLTTEGFEVVITRDPPYFISPWKHFHEFFERGDSMTKLAEAMLLLTARIDNSEREIETALNRGAVVIADRYVDSWYAYQSIRLSDYFGSQKKALDFLVALHRLFAERNLLLTPDLTIWISDNPHQTIKRAEQEQKISKYENLPMQILVDKQYRALSTKFPRRIKEVNVRKKDIGQAYQLIKAVVFKSVGV